MTELSQICHFRRTEAVIAKAKDSTMGCPSQQVHLWDLCVLGMWFH